MKTTRVLVVFVVCRKWCQQHWVSSLECCLQSHPPVLYYWTGNSQVHFSSCLYSYSVGRGQCYSIHSSNIRLLVHVCWKGNWKNQLSSLSSQWEVSWVDIHHWKYVILRENGEEEFVSFSFPSDQCTLTIYVYPPGSWNCICTCNSHIWCIRNRTVVLIHTRKYAISWGCTGCPLCVTWGILGRTCDGAYYLPEQGSNVRRCVNQCLPTVCGTVTIPDEHLKVCLLMGVYLGKGLIHLCSKDHPVGVC